MEIRAVKKCNGTRKVGLSAPSKRAEEKKKKQEGLYGRTKIRKDPVGPYRKARKIWAQVGLHAV